MSIWNKLRLAAVVHYGIGKHGNGVTLNMFVSIAKVRPQLSKYCRWDELAEWIQLEFALQLTYWITITLAKASVLMLYRRIFTLRARWFRIAWWANVLFLLSYYIGINLQTFLQCTPQSISHFWNPESPCHPSGNAHVVVFGSWNALVDVTILVLPMRMVWSLQMSRKQKIAVSGIFLLGLM